MKNIVIISGGASGLGFELCKQLLEKGYSVCNLNRDSQNLKKADEYFSKYKNYKSFCGDISNESFDKKTINSIFKLGDVCALINNAGESRFALPAENNSTIVDACFKGLHGMIYLSTYVLQKFESTGGKIINIMSSAALRGNKQESVYCATKWGQKGYTESLKAAYKGSNIHIMGVYPGGIDTNFYKNSRDYVGIEKSSTFMSAKEVAEMIILNAFSKNKLNVSDLIIERI